MLINNHSTLEPLSKVSKTPILLSCRESVMENKTSFYGRFYIGPLDVGQGITLANALRRSLLSELSGIAITSVEIEGVSHEYSTLIGVRESVLDILLNLKQLVLKSTKSIKRPQTAYLCCQGPGVIRAGDLLLPLGIQCVDPEQYVATLSSDGLLKMKLIIRQGKNYLVQTPKTFFASQFATNSSNSDSLSETSGPFLNLQKIEVEPKVGIKKDEEIKTKTKFFIYKLVAIEKKFNNFKNSVIFKTKVKDRSLDRIFDYSKNKYSTNQLFKKQILYILSLKLSNSSFNSSNGIQNIQNYTHLFSSLTISAKNTTKPLFIDAVFMPVTKVNYTLEENKQKLFDQWQNEFNQLSDLTKGEDLSFISSDYVDKSIKKQNSLQTNSKEKSVSIYESKLQGLERFSAFFNFKKGITETKFSPSNEFEKGMSLGFERKVTNTNDSISTNLNAEIFFEHFNQSPKDIIILEIWTNGSILPRTALKRATKNLSTLFVKFQKAKIMKNNFFQNNQNYAKTIKQLYEKYQYPNF